MQRMKWTPESLAYRPGRLAGNPPHIQWIADRLGSGLFVDVGANVGVFSIAVLLLRPDASAVAFEPQADVADVLERLAAHNAVDVDLHRVALGAEPGTAVLKMERQRKLSGHATTGSAPGFTVHKTETVTVTTLDDWWAGAGQPDVQVVKVDAEGAEVDIVRGGMALLETVPYLFIECGAKQLRQHGQSVPVLKGLLKALGYTWDRAGQNLRCEKRGHK